MESLISEKLSNTLESIFKKYYSLCDDKYLPAQINIGSLYGSENSGRELYINLVGIRPKSKINECWVTDNLSPSFDNNAFNFLVNYKYKYNEIIGVNSLVLNSSDISFVEQKSIDLLDLEYYGDTTRLNHYKILKKFDYGIGLYFEGIKFLTLLSEYSDPKYDLAIEFEYRELTNEVNLDKVGKITFNDGYVELIYNEDPMHGLKGEKKQMLYWLRGTFRLDLTKLLCAYPKKNNKLDNRFKVVDITTGKIRGLNRRNFNDDIDAGVLIFKNEAVKLLRQYYYFYALELIPKSADVKACLYDYLDKYITFWEAEFNNNIPEEIKELLLEYNVDTITKNFISQPMFDWQLMGSWDIYDKLIPHQKLARKIQDNYHDRAIDIGLDFYPPTDISDYSIFLTKVFKLFGISQENLFLNKEKKKLLKDIISCAHVFNDFEDMFNNYEGFCLFLLHEYFNEKN